MGIDFGLKRTGIALSDEEGKIAFPKAVLLSKKDLLEEVVDIFKTEGVSIIILGESKDFLGKDNPVMSEINIFKKKLEDELGINVILEPEFMTSMEAEHIQGKGNMHDASAATIILQSYLDKKQNEHTL